VRASTFPSCYGEKLVLHIASPVMALKDLNELGLPQRMLPPLISALGRPSGLILTTGPAGSGKTSTLYSLIQSLDSGKRNIVTLEEAIEMRMPNLTQGETNARAGFTFATGLHAIEGQDPDVILVGELHDVETAATAFRCALTGRLVLSALPRGHVETIRGFSTWASTVCRVGLSVIIAQRLIRLLCPLCRRLRRPMPRRWPRSWGSRRRTFRRSSRGQGCDKCSGSGARAGPPSLKSSAG
jgi:general secretion pathway protein E